MKISREGKTITIECPDNGAADHLEVRCATASGFSSTEKAFAWPRPTKSPR